MHAWRIAAWRCRSSTSNSTRNCRRRRDARVRGEKLEVSTEGAVGGAIGGRRDSTCRRSAADEQDGRNESRRSFWPAHAKAESSLEPLREMKGAVTQPSTARRNPQQPAAVFSRCCRKRRVNGGSITYDPVDGGPNRWRAGHRRGDEPGARRGQGVRLAATVKDEPALRREGGRVDCCLARCRFGGGR